MMNMDQINSIMINQINQMMMNMMNNNLMGNNIQEKESFQINYNKNEFLNALALIKFVYLRKIQYK